MERAQASAWTCTQWLRPSWVTLCLPRHTMLRSTHGASPSSSTSSRKCHAPAHKVSAAQPAAEQHCRASQHTQQGWSADVACVPYSVHAHMRTSCGGLWCVHEMQVACVAARRAPAQRLWGGWSSFKARAWTPRVDLLTPTGSTSRPVAWFSSRPGACQHSSLRGAGSALWTSAHGEVRGLLGACIVRSLLARPCHSGAAPTATAAFAGNSLPHCMRVHHRMPASWLVALFDRRSPSCAAGSPSWLRYTAAHTRAI